MKKSPLTNFQRATEVHPRNGVLDNDAIARYAERYAAGGEPPPVIVQRTTMMVVDGWHRIEAAQRAGLAELPYEEISIADDDIKRTAYRLNRDHGVPISKEQRNTMIAEDAERFTQAELAEFYGLTRQAIGYILGNTSNAKTSNTSKKDHREKIEAADIVATWRLRPEATQEEIAAQFSISQQRVAQILADFRASVIGAYESGKLKLEVAMEFTLPVEMVDTILLKADHEPINFEPRIYQTWNIGKLDSRYGQKHPGQLPAEVLQNLLYYYTRPGDRIVDLFGGGGLTLDVAADMVSRTCNAYDIEPARPDIEKWDIISADHEVQLPMSVMQANMVFLDPPYWKQKRGEYTKQDTDLSNLPLDVFHEVLAEAVLACLRAIPSNAHVALIIGPTQDGWQLIDHAAHIMGMVGVPTHRIQVPYSTQQHGGNYVNMAKEARRWLYLSRDLMIWTNSTGTHANSEATPQNNSS